jgi:membrane fusion protein, multidrug efflux system
MNARLVLLASALLVLGRPAFAQFGPSGPPAVGVVKAVREPITESDQFVGRVQAVNRVAVVARVTAFLDKRLFTEGTEVKQGDLLYRLEQPPFQADLAAKQASVAQANAQLQNATINLNRAAALLNTPAGQRSTYDDALATQRSDAAQLAAAQANLQTSQINLNYTEIHSPIDGLIGRTAITEGNVVSPSSGTLTTIVSQDPMYVTFPVSTRAALALRDRYAGKGGFSAVVIKLQLPDGRTYDQEGKLDFVDNTIAQTTDTILLRGAIPNPVRPGSKPGEVGARELADGEFVTVLLQGVEPVQVLAVPRAAVLTDQQGSYVYVVDAQNKVSRANIQLGQSTPTTAVITSGLQEGQTVVVDGVQRVRPGITVNPGPASVSPALPAGAGQGGGSGGGGGATGGGRATTPTSGNGGASSGGVANGSAGAGTTSTGASPAAAPGAAGPAPGAPPGNAASGAAPGGRGSVQAPASGANSGQH